jgi:cholesterol transport system auxiliary component
LKRSTSILVWVLPLAFALSACSVVRAPERPGWTTFVLERKPSSNIDLAPAARVASTLRIAAMRSAGGYDTPRMAYSRSGGEIEYYARHRWAERPAEMLEDLLVASLERSGDFAAVLSPSSRADGDLFLETELLEFRQELSGSAAFHLALRATLVDEESRRVVGTSRTFEIIETMEGASPSAGAIAAQRAGERLVAEVAAYCAAAAEPRPLTEGARAE